MTAAAGWINIDAPPSISLSLVPGRSSRVIDEPETCKF